MIVEGQRKSLAGQGEAETNVSDSKDRDSIHKVPIEEIAVGVSARSIKPDTVEALVGSFRTVGQISPVLLYRTPDGQLRLVVGKHRLEAAKKLGWKEIKATIVDLDEVEREICQIDENLIRGELSELELAEQLHRRKELYDKKGGGKIRTPGGEQKLGFDKAMAEKIGRDKSTIRKARTRAEKIAPQVRDKIRGTPAAEKGAELDALAAMPVEDQERAVKLYADDEVKSLREARSRIEVKPGPSQEEKDENDFQRIRAAWEKSGDGGRRKFESWRAQKRNVATKTTDRPAQNDAAPTPPCDVPTASNPIGPTRYQDEAPAAGRWAKGQTEPGLGDIDVDRMMKDDMRQFVACNKLNVPGFDGKTIPQMREALKKHLQATDPPEGGWKMAAPAPSKHQ